VKKSAVAKLVALVQRSINSLPIAEQIEAYEALGHLMPSKRERKAAQDIAWLLRTAEKHQLNFTNQLFKELQWPGHQHDGSPDRPKGGAQ